MREQTTGTRLSQDASKWFRQARRHGKPRPEEKGTSTERHPFKTFGRHKFVSEQSGVGKTLRIISSGLRQICWLLCCIHFCYLLLQVDAMSPGVYRGSRISCKSNEAVLEGEPSSINCYYPDDLRQWKLGFDIIKYDFEQLDPVGDLILSCIWNADKTDPECTQKKGYVVNTANIRKKVTLDISKTQKEHAGKYICRYALSWGSDHTHCTLAVKGLQVSCTTPSTPIPLGAEGFITCHFNSDLTKTREKFHVYRFEDGNSSPTQVLYCTWGRENDRPRCRVEPGYHVDYTNINTEVTLKISSVEAMHSGRYSCRTIPYNRNVQVSDCTLSVQDERHTVDQGVNGSPHLHGLNVILMTICFVQHVCVR